MINLVKGQAIDLVKEAGGNLQRVDVSINWKENTTSGAAFDPDVVAFINGDNDKVINDSGAIFSFGNPKSPDGSVVHSGDDTRGGTGETISVDLDKLAAEVQSVMFSVTIYHAKARGQNFGAINGLNITVRNADTGEEIATSDLSFDDSLFTALNFGKLERHGGTWGFRVVGEGYNDGLKKLFEDHGIQVGQDEYDEGTD